MSTRCDSCCHLRSGGALEARGVDDTWHDERGRARSEAAPQAREVLEFSMDDNEGATAQRSRRRLDARDVKRPVVVEVSREGLGSESVVKVCTQPKKRPEGGCQNM